MLYNQTIDGNRTSQLLTAISDPHYDAADLRSLLLTESPFLSDTVLKAYFSSSLTPFNYLAEIHNLNKPVSDAVWELITGLNLDPGELDLLQTQQSDEQVSARDTLQGLLSKAYFDRESIYNEKLHYYLQDTLPGARDSVVSLIANHQDVFVDAPLRLLHAYKNAADYTKAFALADSLTGSTAYGTIMELELALLKLDTSAKGVFTILDNQALRDVILDFAEDSTKAGSWQARAVRNLVYGTDMYFRYLQPELEGSGERKKRHQEEEIDKALRIATVEEAVNIFPNPSEQTFFITYLSPNTSSLKYLVHDLLGKKITGGQIKPGETAELNCADCLAGLYFITLTYENKPSETRKIVLVKH